MLKKDYKSLFNRIPLDVSAELVAKIYSHKEDASTNYLRRHNLSMMIPSMKGSIVTSSIYNDLMLSFAYMNNILYKRCNILSELEKEVNKYTNIIVSETSKQIEEVISKIDAIETKLAEDYSVVSVEKFNDRNKRQLISISDPRTQIPIILLEELNVEELYGLTLPIESISKIEIGNISIDYDLTSVGDTDYTIEYKDPNSLLQNDIFLWRVLRKVKTSDNQKVIIKDNRLVLILDLAGYQAMNSLFIESASRSIFSLKKLSYINSAGQIVNIEVNENIELCHKIFFDTIFTSKLVLEFESLIANNISRIKYKDNYLNKILSGHFSTLTDDISETIDGKIFDCSIKSIKLFNIKYDNSGFWLSERVTTQNPIGVDIDLLTETISIENSNIPYVSELFLPDNIAFIDTYLLSKIDNHYVTCPIPYTEQHYEKVIFSNLDSKMIFFPDFDMNINSWKISSILYLNNYVLISLKDPHYLETGVPNQDLISLYISKNANYNVTSYQWAAPTENTILMKRSDDISFLGYIDNTSELKGYVIRASNLNPFLVYKENTLLSIGTDYKVSIDNGITFNSNWPTAAEYEKATRKAGHCKIQFNNIDETQHYYVIYYHAPNQMLDESDQFSLINNEFVISSDISSDIKDISVFIRMASHYYHNDISPFIKYLKFKIREN